MFRISEDKFEPIFVVGCQRSGTTFLSSILSAHHNIKAIPEGQFFIDCMPPDISNINVENLLLKIENHYRFKIWNSKLPNIEKNFINYSDFVRAFIYTYLSQFQSEKAMAATKYWVDHQPGHVRHLAKLHKIFPNCKVIILIRDGRAIANSIMPLDWGPNSITRAAYYWEQRLAHSFAAKQYLGNQAIIVRYEDILSESKVTIGNICNFLDVPFESNMLNANGFSVPKFTKEQHNLVGNGIVRNRIDSWKDSLSQREIEVFESLTDDILLMLGYEKHSTQAVRLKMHERMKYDALHVFRSLTNKIKFRRRFKNSQK